MCLWRCNSARFGPLVLLMELALLTNIFYMYVVSLKGLVSVVVIVVSICNIQVLFMLKTVYFFKIGLNNTH